MAKAKKILVYGYGNPGRQDDGLGIFLSERIDEWIKKENIHFVNVDYNYQLNVEDAYEIADKDIVIFIDASKEEIDDYTLTEVKPAKKLEFTSHFVSPSYLLNLCNVMFSKAPVIYLLHIKGYKWKFCEEMTEDAKNNMNKAYDFLKNFILNS